MYLINFMHYKIIIFPYNMMVLKWVMLNYMLLDFPPFLSLCECRVESDIRKCTWYVIEIIKVKHWMLKKGIIAARVSKYSPRSSYEKDVLWLDLICYYKRQEQECKKKSKVQSSVSISWTSFPSFDKIKLR